MLALLAALYALLPGAREARADGAAIDINRFHPAPGTERILATELATVGPHLQLAPQLFFHYADVPMELTLGDVPAAEVVRHRITGEMSLALSLYSRVQLAVAFPVTMYQTGDALDLEPVLDGDRDINPPAEVASFGPEDLRISAKGLLWQRDGYALGASGLLALPTGDTSSYLGAGGPRFDLKLLASMTRGRLSAAVNVGWLFAGTEQVLLTKTGMALTYGLGAQYEVYEHARGAVAITGELFGLTHTRFESSRESPAELLLSAKATYGRWAFFAGGGPGLNHGYGEPNIRALAGASWSWKPAPRPPAPPVPPAPPAPPPPAPPAPEPVETTEWVDTVLTMPSDVMFEFDSCLISPRSHEMLQGVATTLKENPAWGNIRIEGYADSMGDDDYNLRLSRCRAERVVAFLVKQGVAAERLSYLGFGARCHRAPNDSEDNRQKNRRVEFVRDQESNPPRCPVPPQLPPLAKHRWEQENQQKTEQKKAAPQGQDASQEDALKKDAPRGATPQQKNAPQQGTKPQQNAPQEKDMAPQKEAPQNVAPQN